MHGMNFPTSAVNVPIRCPPIEIITACGRRPIVAIFSGSARMLPNMYCYDSLISASSQAPRPMKQVLAVQLESLY